MSALFAIGSNGSGQLGIGHKEDVSVPKPVAFHPEQPISPIIAVAAGGNHTLLLSQQGKVYWSGDGTSGACGIGPRTNIPVFQQIQLGKDWDSDDSEVVLIATTWEASLLVAKDNDGKLTRMYSFGQGNKGELGLGELIVRTPSATRLKHFPPQDTEIVDLAAGLGHVVAVLSNGNVYGWGNCRKGQAGEPSAVIYEPRRIDGIKFKVTRVVCAKESTCLFGEPSGGSLQVLGSDKWQLSSSAPNTVPKWTDVGASWGNFYVLTSQGSLISWGRDDHGQLPPSHLPPIRNIAIGSEHVVALSEAGDVLSWGWGEHGNCGPQVENNDVKGRWTIIASIKFIPAGYCVRSVGAGCATSWIYVCPS